MSDPSHIPPGNRPPAGRVLRPFAGGSAEQGSQSPAAPPDLRAADRRPLQPRRPFVGGQAAPSNAAAAPAIDVSPAIAISPTIDVSPPIDASPVINTSPAIDINAATEVAPAAEAPDATVVERATWLRIVEAEPAVLDFGTDLIGENVTLGDALEVGETSALPLELPAIAEETFAPSFVEPTVSAAEQLPVVTAEVPAIESGQELLAIESGDEVLALVRGALDSSAISAYAELDALDAPLFIAPNSEAAADSVIDEVDAAFITAGLPSTGDGLPSDDALRAAGALEEVARRLRAGNIDLQRAPTSKMSSEEAALAMVLAALLANR